MQYRLRLNHRGQRRRCQRYRKQGGATEDFVFDPEIASLMHQLWQDPVIPKVMDHSSEMDSAN
jgi:hypothetical protein